MREVIRASDVKYTGIDIVPSMIKDLVREFAAENRINFLEMDILNDIIPRGDLLIVRDFLFHLSYADINRFFVGLKRSTFKYILITTHKPDSFRNKDIKTGAYRRLDIFESPFVVPGNVLWRVDDFVYPEYPREMVLFDYLPFVEGFELTRGSFNDI
jgi:hypothetical protein